jgi:hypothetical protein
MRRELARQAGRENCSRLLLASQPLTGTFALRIVGSKSWYVEGNAA